MKIAIIGAGAIGSLVGAALADGGHEVSLVARGAHLGALRERGLTVHWLERGTRHYKLRATDDPVSLGPQQAIFIALKAYSIGPLLPRIARIVESETPVVTAINGLPWWYFYRHGGALEGTRIECLDPDGAMAGALDAKHLVGCVVHAAAEVVAPGVVAHTSGRVFVMGELDGSASARLERLGADMKTGGLEPRLARDIRNEIWMKLIGNLSYNPVAALTLARMNQINANPNLIRMIRAQMVEAMAVAQAYGQPISMSIDERLELARQIGGSKISMHQDLERGRPLEIDAIVTAVLELGRRARVATPMIDAVHALIAERARHVGKGAL